MADGWLDSRVADRGWLVGMAGQDGSPGWLGGVVECQTQSAAAAAAAAAAFIDRLPLPATPSHLIQNDLTRGPAYVSVSVSICLCIYVYIFAAEQKPTKKYNRP